MAEEPAGDEEDDAGCSADAECKSQKCVAGIFSRKPPIQPTRLFAGKEGQIIDADDGGGQGGGATRA